LKYEGATNSLRDGPLHETPPPATEQGKDFITGATALVADESVLTRNVTDFERMPGVAVETY
jgi:hypothetical protein